MDTSKRSFQDAPYREQGETLHRRISHIIQPGHINEAGHRDQLERHYGLASICGLALTIDNAWVAFGGTLTIAVYNGGAPGVLYELLTACFYYGFVAASIAELASSIPTAGGVYHWATITAGPKYGRVNGFFTGWLNLFGWLFDLASIASIPANIVLQMYAVFHPDYIFEEWHVYVALLIITWACTAFVIFGNKLMPATQSVGLFLVIVGGLVTIIVVVAMPKTHASHSFVWSKFVNTTGWSNGVAFLTSVLNGAFTIGTPDAITHMAEELPEPKRDMPKAIAAQVILGTITSFCYAIAILYAISDFDAVLSSSGAFPLAEVYAQATGSAGGTFGLLLIIFFSVMICTVGTLLTVSRILWALARDNAVPFSSTFSQVNERLSCPVPATLFAAIGCSAFGAIQVGSKTAFTDLVGSFIILTTTSYGLAIGPHLFTGRTNVPRGPFWMGKAGFFINGVTLVLIVFFNIMFCFPYSMPAATSTMNYNSVILVGVVLMTGSWWAVYAARHYEGPKLTELYVDKIIDGESTPLEIVAMEDDRVREKF